MTNNEKELQAEIDRLRNNLLDLLGDVLDAKYVMKEKFGVPQDSFMEMFNSFINDYEHKVKE